MADKKIMLRIAPSSGDPVKGTGGMDQNVLYSPGKSNAERSFDLQDRIMELISTNNQLKPDDKKAIYSSLQTTLGPEKANKLMNHVYIFNTRPDMQKMPLEDKIKAFYQLGSNDPDIQGYIDKTKSLGYGPQSQFRGSISAINSELSGRNPVVQVVQPSENQKKIMLSVRK